MLVADELAGPADYADGWWVLAVVLVVLVVVWNGGLLWWGRPRRLTVEAPPVPVDVEAVRAEHLARLARLDAAVRSGALAPRAAHQQLSVTVRSFVHATTDVPASHLTLSELRDRDVPSVVSAVEVMYPPEFAPGDDRGRASWEHALELARRAVGSP